MQDRPEFSPSAIPYLPPVTGPEPSSQLAAFYYPWYRTQEFDGEWAHWDGAAFTPPLDISSDYYPKLGAYSTMDERVLSQHFAWLRQAGVGVIITSWWGPGSREDQNVLMLLKVGERYGIKVAFHIEPYESFDKSRTADQLVKDVEYIYNRYGASPAFYRTTGTSRWSKTNQPKGLFFLYAPSYTGNVTPDALTVEGGYWQAAMDAIHASPEGGLVIAGSSDGGWVDSGHFDGVYNYITLNLEQEGGFLWAQGLPLGAWYVPSLIPGNSARRIGYPESTYVSRRDGITYREQWQAAFSTGVQPDLVTITSFNEWHEGSQIEPIALGAENGAGYTYQDFGLVPPDGYLTLTRELAAEFLTNSQTQQAGFPIRLHITTTSDWSNVGLVSGGNLIRPTILETSEEATQAGFYSGFLGLNQPLARAQSGGKVEVTVDLVLTNTTDQPLVLAIQRGYIGYTKVDLYRFEGNDPILVETFLWDGIVQDPLNTQENRIPIEHVVGP